jgi:hypothetical protein
MPKNERNVKFFFLEGRIPGGASKKRGGGSKFLFSGARRETSDKNDCLVAGDFEPPPAPGVWTGHGIVHPYQIVSGFGELGAVLFVGSGRERLLFRPAHPADIELAGLAALWADIADPFGLDTLNVKISFVHGFILRPGGQ